MRFGGEDIFTGIAPTPGPVVQPQSFGSEFERSPAAPENAEGSMTLKIAATGAVTLKLEIKNLPAGSYAVKVAGVERGTLVMKSDEGPTKGDLKFTTNPNENDEAMLDFEPSFQAVSIEKDDTVFMTGTSSGPPPAP